MSNILVVGSLSYDSIRTPEGVAEHVLGGSANYFSLASSLYSKVRVVGVVGEDYDEKNCKLLRDRGVDLDGMTRAPGKTFFWAGRYDSDMNEAITLQTELNVLEHFDPVLPASYTNSEYIFLANIDPTLQLKVLDQCKGPKLVGADTMNFWIDRKKDDLLQVLKRIDVLLINETESMQLTGQTNAIAASGEILKMGPKAVVIKRGEYGFVLHTQNQFFILPAFPIGHVVDPTGAGDTFAGGFFGYLSKSGQSLDMAALKQACLHGCLLASFTVEGFGIEALRDLSWPKIEQRHQEYLQIVCCNP